MEQQRYMRIIKMVRRRLRNLRPEDRQDCIQYVAMRVIEKDDRCNINHLISDWCRENGWSRNRSKYGSVPLGFGYGREFSDSAHGSVSGPMDGLVSLELDRILARVSGRERAVLEMTAEGLLLREIAKVLNVSESRACQLLKSGIATARRKLEMLGKNDEPQEKIHTATTLVAGTHIPQRRWARPKDQLSDREQEVVAAVCTGLRNKEIAANLFVCEKTIKFHLTTIYKKLGVASRAQLIVKMTTAHQVGTPPSMVPIAPPVAQDAIEADVSLPSGEQTILPFRLHERHKVARDIRAIAKGFDRQEVQDKCNEFARFLEECA